MKISEHDGWLSLAGYPFLTNKGSRKPNEEKD